MVERPPALPLLDDIDVMTSYEDDYWHLNGVTDDTAKNVIGLFTAAPLGQ